MVANGGELHVLDQTKVILQVGGVKDNFTCLVVREITQECTLELTSLRNINASSICIIDLHQQILQAGKQSMPFCNHDANPQETKTICHVSFCKQR